MGTGGAVPARKADKVSNYVAVNRAEAQGAGALVWWTINGSVKCQALEDAWALRVDLDPDLLMKRPTPGAALRRALGRQVRSTPDGKILLSSLGEENAYALVRQTVNGFDGEPEHVTLLKARLAGDDGDQLDLVVLADCPDHVHAAVRGDYEVNLTTFSGDEISSWFSGVLLPAFDAVSLRRGGGMWFVPATQLNLWYQAVDAVRDISGHQIYKMPALSTEAEAVEGILVALASEAEEAARLVEEEIMADDIGVRGLKNRVARLDRVTAKVVAYEGMLGANLQTLRDRLDGLNAQMAAAIFTAEAAKDATQEAA
jgi:hypothetical protein